jgi:hypothetical protein
MVVGLALDHRFRLGRYRGSDLGRLTRRPRLGTLQLTAFLLYHMRQFMRQ